MYTLYSIQLLSSVFSLQYTALVKCVQYTVYSSCQVCSVYSIQLLLSVYSIQYTALFWDVSSVYSYLHDTRIHTSMFHLLLVLAHDAAAILRCVPPNAM